MDTPEESTAGPGPVAGLTSQDLEMVTTPCSSFTCPAVYRTTRQTVVVQGHLVGSRDVGIDTAADERLVEIPEDMLLEAAARIQQRRTRL